MASMTKEEAKASFIKKSNIKFNNKFSYYKVDYKNYLTKVTIYCPIHGDIQVTPDNHYKSKYGCHACSLSIPDRACKGVLSPTKTTETFIKESQEIHKFKYSYEKTIYLNRLSPVTITCPKHGDFVMKQAFRHLEGRSCNECDYERKFLTKEEFLKRVPTNLKEYYSYTNTIYKGLKHPITVTCPKHGDYEVVASKHLQGVHCKTCTSM